MQAGQCGNQIGAKVNWHWFISGDGVDPKVKANLNTLILTVK